MLARVHRALRTACWRPFFAARTRGVTDAAVLCLVYAYLCQFFPADVIFSDTTTTGGDTGSHYGLAVLFRDYFLGEGDVVHWLPGNYGGSPGFILYFPLLFILMSLTSLAIPFNVAFKLYSLLGVFLLPLCSYLFLRLCRVRFPAPGLGAAASVLYLLNESNSMWGGNLLSTLAGQFSYAFSFSMTFLFLGLLFNVLLPERPSAREAAGSGVGADAGRVGGSDSGRAWRVLLLMLLVFLVGFSHIFTLEVCVLASSFFLFHPRRFVRRALFLGLILGGGGLLFSGWFVQLVLQLPFSTSFNVRWGAAWEALLPKPLWLPLALLVTCTICACIPTSSRWQRMNSSERRALGFVWFILGACVLSYLGADVLKVPDIRFVPFIQYLVTVFGVAYVGVVLPQKLWRSVVPVIACGAVLLWAESFPSQVPQWSRWNYSGFEAKPGWSVFRAINEKLRGDFSQPRVAYEHSQRSDSQFGTSRAFESLPTFASRATLDGLHFQMSLLSPFVFFTQALISRTPACPFPDYPCTAMDLARAADQLQLLNVKEVILVSSEAKAEAARNPRYRRVERIGDSPYEVWEFGHDYGYVEPLDRDPEYVEEKGFRSAFFHWYQGYRPGVSFLYTLPRTYGALTGTARISLPPKAERVSPHGDQDCGVHETVDEEQIRFTTRCLNRPHLIKVAYHPGWEVDRGASGPYLVSPAFLLVYPTAEEVSLSFRNTGPRRLGVALNLMGLMILMGAVAWVQPAVRRSPWVARIRGIQWIDHPRLNLLGFLTYLAGILIVVWRVIVVASQPSYPESLAQARQIFQGSDLEAAQRAFQLITERWPDEPTLAEPYYYWASSYIRAGDCSRALPVLAELTRRFPGSSYAAEATFHLGQCAEGAGNLPEAERNYREVIERFAPSSWAEHATRRLAEIERAR